MSNLEQILDECLVQIESGAWTLDECLARYPQYAGELRRLLKTSALLQHKQSVQASPTFKSRTRAQLIAQARARPHRARPLHSIRTLTFRLALGVVVIALVLFTGGTAFAQTALPGDPFYGWKILSEEIWRSVQPDPLAADLALTERRAKELIRVANDPKLQTLALQRYQHAVDDLKKYTNPISQSTIDKTLSKHRADFESARVDVSKLQPLFTVTPPTVRQPTSMPAINTSIALTPTSTPTPPVNIPSPAVPTLPALSTALPIPTVALPITLPTPPPRIP